MDRGTLLKVRDGSEDPLGGPGRVRGHSWRSELVQGTLGEVRDKSRDPWEGS